MARTRPDNRVESGREVGLQVGGMLADAAAFSTTSQIDRDVRSKRNQPQ